MQFIIRPFVSIIIELLGHSIYLPIPPLTAACTDWDLRLVNGSQPLEGTVQVCFNNTYGTICHDQWNENDARVVCRHLGYSSENTSALTNSFFGRGSGPIFLDRVQCLGHEVSLYNCSLSMDIGECTHQQDAGVSCSGTFIL